MPIRPASAIQLKTEAEFREADYRVMGKAFEIHNELGPYFDEVVYKNELAYRLTEARVTAFREFPVELAFERYLKTVFIDLLVDHGIVYEVKTAASFAPAHRSQALNYLFATGTKYGKLINFRGAKVSGEYVSTSLSHQERQDITILEEGWDAVDSAGERWRERVASLVADWGSGLNLNWYREAICELLGGLSRTESEIPIVSQGRPIGSHRIRLLTTDTMWSLTAVKEHSLMKEHLRRFLSLSCLKRIQWANIHNQQLRFQTIAL